jgi:thymidylate synthase
MDTLDLGYVEYLPFEQRTPDEQYINLIRHIYETGRWVKPIQGDRSKMVVGAQLRYDMKNGFPVDTHRNLHGAMFHGTLGELVGFLNGAETLEELMSYGMPKVFWDRWLTPEKCAQWGLEPGHLGSASYGAAWTRIPTRDGGTFNQIDALVNGLRSKPFLRTWKITPWYPPEIIGAEGTRKVVVAPCHGEVHVIAYPEERELSLHHVQRSGDLPVGAVLNMIQYPALGMMLAKLLGYKFVEYVHTFSDVHMYEMQLPFVEELLSRPTKPFPTVTLNGSPERLQDFRTTDFVLGDDYDSGEKMRIPTPI